MDEKIFSKFKQVLAQSLMLDHAELDFGIYRIMNQKREQILRFLNNDLPRLVEKTLNEFVGTDIADLKKQLAEKETAVRQLGIDPAQAKPVQELRERLSRATDTEAMEGHVYDHLAHFLARYYDNGDFMPIRRYRSGDTYAIPYDGEEVKLYWANADQFYIKTAEYFRHYAFNAPNGKRVEFTLREATTEQNNNKEEKGKERRFRLAEESPVEMQDDTLHIYFTYEPMPKATKQKTLADEAFERLKGYLPPDYHCLLAPYKEGADRSLLEKHLTDYVAKNSFDYFIHKDLKGFLNRELDFYVKNEMLVIDDIDSQDSRQFLGVLAEVKAVKVIGGKIIDFLAQIENFQKRLWLKRKFVTQADYCITLDRIPRELYAEICANDRQREEWVRLFAIDEIRGDLLSAGYSEPLTEAFLEANPYLVLDTALFPLDFKHRLLAAIPHIDEQCNGLLINSENFQALRLIEEKYREEIKCIYIDPPYNTGNDDFIYKDNYKESSWLSCMQDRLLCSKSFFAPGGSIAVSIDINELDKLIELLDRILGIENRKANITVRRASISGAKVINPGVVNISENVVMYANGIGKWMAHDAYRERGYDDRYGKMIVNVSEPYTQWKFSTVLDEFAKSKDISKQKLKKELGEKYADELLEFIIKNAQSVIRLASLDEDSVSEEVINLKDKSKKEPNKIFLMEREGFADYYIINGNAILFYKDRLRRIGDRLVPVEKVSDIWDDVLPNDIHNEGGVVLKKGKKPEKLIDRILESTSNRNDIVLDYFAGSATSGAVCLKCQRKFINIEVSDYFDQIPLRRIKNTLKGDSSGVTYKYQWKGGGMVKYLRLEQYEDTLNNLELPKKTDDDGLFEGQFRTEYTLGYMLDTETADSLLNMEWFDHPFDVNMKITKGTETTMQTIDLVETFNYLIGLEVDTMEWPEEGLCIVQGSMRQGGKTVVIWRDKDKVSDDSLKALLTGRKWEAKRIFLNGDTAVIASLRNSLAAKVMNTEEEFKQRMFDEKD